MPVSQEIQWRDPLPKAVAATFWGSGPPGCGSPAGSSCCGAFRTGLVGCSIRPPPHVPERGSPHRPGFASGRPRPAADPPGRQRWHCARRSARHRRRARPAARRVMGGAGPVPRVEYLEVLLPGLAQLLRESTHQRHSFECTPRSAVARRDLQLAAQADPDFDVVAGIRSRRGRGVRAGQVRSVGGSLQSPP